MDQTTIDWTLAIFYTVMPWIVLVGQLPWIGIVVQLLVTIIAALLAHRIITHLLERVAAPFPFSRRLVQYGHRAGGVVVFLLIAQVILRNAPDDLPAITLLRHLNALGIIAAMTWLAVRCVQAVSDTIIEVNPAHAVDNLRARRIQTHTKVLSRSLMVLIVLIGAGAGLSTLPSLRQIGTSLLASAGFAGLVVGFAAKPILGNLLAGMQLALTQPIRLEDVVIVQNEWGWIEEITGTYVVVRIWDQRRMVVPLQWFIENPFQNWTRNNSEILGTVFIWVDYRTPVELLRHEAERICQDAPEWDGRLCQTQVTEAGERAVQVRILVSAADSSKAWDLRCRMREELVHYLQLNYPEHLPRVRAEVSGLQSGGDEKPSAHQ
jgi:small-conductance mechanosensitive channel